MKLTVNSNFPFRISAINYASDGNVTLTIESEATTTESQYRYEADFGMQQAEERVPVSLVQYASDFTESHHVKEKTKSSYLLMLKHLKCYGDIDLEHITTIYLQDFITYMESQGLGRGTVRLYFQKLACVLHHAYKQENLILIQGSSPIIPTTTPMPKRYGWFSLQSLHRELARMR